MPQHTQGEWIASGILGVLALFIVIAAIARTAAHDEYCRLHPAAADCRTEVPTEQPARVAPY